MASFESNSPRPHCTKCGAYLDGMPDNAFGWCGACQAWAQMGGLRPAPAQPAPPAEPVTPAWPGPSPSLPGWPRARHRYICTSAYEPGAWTYTAPLQVPGFSGTMTKTLHAPHC